MFVTERNPSAIALSLLLNFAQRDEARVGEEECGGAQGWIVSRGGGVRRGAGVDSESGRRGAGVGSGSRRWSEVACRGEHIVKGTEQGLCEYLG